MPILVEACVDSVASAVAAERGGARRLELCDNLADAGTTPSAGMIAAVKAHVGVPVFPIVRARGGGFVYSPLEVDVMRRDIRAARQLGADGIVTGALDASGCVDQRIMLDLIEVAGELPVTFHRAFDVVPDLDAALETLIEMGVQRVLTSGGAPTAVQGADRLASLVARAGKRLAILAGGGVREENVRQLIERSGVTEIHVRGTVLRRAPARSSAPLIRFRKALPDDENAWEETDESRISQIRRLADDVARATT